MATPGGSRGASLGSSATPGGGSSAKTVKPGATKTTAGPNVQGTSNSPCLISYPSASIPIVGTVGGACLISKTNVRAWVGGILIGAGAILMLGGVVILAAAGFKKTGLVDRAANLAGKVPTPAGQAVATGLRVASRG